MISPVMGDIILVISALATKWQKFSIININALDIGMVVKSDKPLPGTLKDLKICRILPFYI